VLGGIAALCGAASYAELGAALPRSGGEYNFLGRVYHPVAGFISGWISAVIGFAAPVAASAIVFAKYFTAALPGNYGPWTQKGLAIAVVLLATTIHGRNRLGSGRFQTLFTALKIGLIILFCMAGLFVTKDVTDMNFAPQTGDWSTMTSGAFAVALIYVSYGYAGWNAATYISGEMEHPQRDLPRVLLIGTSIVMALYVALNFIFLRVAPVEAMLGKEEVGYIAAGYIFGESGARAVGFMLSRPYKTWGYPLTPLIYIALTAFTLVFVIKTNPTKALFALVIISVGGLFYWISEKANMAIAREIATRCCSPPDICEGV